MWQWKMGNYKKYFSGVPIFKTITKPSQSLFIIFIFVFLGSPGFCENIQEGILCLVSLLYFYSLIFNIFKSANVYIGTITNKEQNSVTFINQNIPLCVKPNKPFLYCMFLLVCFNISFNCDRVWHTGVRHTHLCCLFHF